MERALGRGWLALLLLLPAGGAWALVAREPEVEASAALYARPAPAISLRREEGLDEGSSTYVDLGDDTSNVSLFDARWRTLFSKEQQREHGRHKLPSAVQLAMGVFTVAAEQAYRDAVRKTWMKQEGVCLLSRGKKAGCSIYVAFVIGASGNGERLGRYKKGLIKTIRGDARKEEGMLVLNIKENMNSGKTFEYFRVVAEKYPWITHVAKCDLDTYPFLHKLVDKIYQQSLCQPSPYVFGGKPAQCPEESGCEGLLKGEFQHLCPSKHSCLAQSAPWSFNFGQLYFMSMPLVREIAIPGGVWQQPPKMTHEDIITGLAVQTFAKERARRNSSFCLSVWEPKAHCHKGHCKPDFGY